MNLKKTAQCATLILVSAISGVAVASVSKNSLASVTVRYSDLDLNTEADVTALYKRIRRAAYQVCVVPMAGRELHASRIAKECRMSSVGRAVQQVGVPALIELHQKKMGNAGLVQTAANR